MRRFSYLLILLLISAQVDDYWIAAPALLSASLADDNDVYLPTQKRPEERGRSASERQVFGGLTLPHAAFSLVPSSVPLVRNLPTPSASPPLYVLMSLQI